jgi:hypothetical protein
MTVLDEAVWDEILADVVSTKPAWRDIDRAAGEFTLLEFVERTGIKLDAARRWLDQQIELGRYAKMKVRNPDGGTPVMAYRKVDQ